MRVLLLLPTDDETMTTVQELTANILSSAQAQALEIEKETRDALDVINKETAMFIEKERERIYAKAHHQQEEINAKASAKLRLAVSREELVHKQHLVTETFHDASKQLAKLKVADRRLLIQRLWKKASSKMTVAVIIAARQDAAQLATLKKNTLKRTAQGVPSPSLRIISGLGGFIAISADRTITMDLRFETILSDIRVKKSAEVAVVLFNESTGADTVRGNLIKKSAFVKTSETVKTTGLSNRKKTRVTMKKKTEKKKTLFGRGKIKITVQTPVQRNSQKSAFKNIRKSSSRNHGTRLRRRV